MFYEQRDRYEDAEAAYKRALAVQEEELAPDDPKIASTLDRLAWLCGMQLLKYPEAENYYRRSLVIGEKNISPDTPQNVFCPSGLAFLLVRQGRYREAESLLRDSLKTIEAVVGAGHPKTAGLYRQIAGYHHRTGQLEKAAYYYKKVAEIYREDRNSMFYEHNLKGVLNNLAGIYKRQSKYKEAEVLYTEVLEISEKSERFVSAYLKQSRRELASLYREQGRYENALFQYERILETTVVEFGPDHFRVAETKLELAPLYIEMEKYEEAETLCGEARLIIVEALKKNTPLQPVKTNWVSLRDEKSPKVGPYKLCLQPC